MIEIGSPVAPRCVPAISARKGDWRSAAAASGRHNSSVRRARPRAPAGTAQGRPTPSACRSVSEPRGSATTGTRVEPRLVARVTSVPSRSRAVTDRDHRSPALWTQARYEKEAARLVGVRAEVQCRPGASRLAPRPGRFIVGAADEARDEEVRGVGRTAACGSSTCCSSPLAQHGDAVAHRHRLDLVVRDVDRRRAELAAGCARSPRASATRSLASRFESGSSIRNAAGSRTIARPIATRWRWPPESWRGLRSSSSLEAERLRAALDAALDLGLRHLAQLEAEGDVVVDRHVRVERVVLEHHRDVALAAASSVVDDAVADPRSRPR